MNNYVVRVLGLPEHERVILKLIFSISEKSKLRRNIYTLAADLDEPADVVIRDVRHAPTPARDVRRELLVINVPSSIDRPVILRPLIATRVLAVLDDVFAAAVAAPAIVAEPQSNSSVVLPFAAAIQPVADTAIAASEAQESNDDASGISAAQGAEVAAVVDEILLSIPSEAPQVDIFSLPDEASDSAETLPPVVHSKPRALVVDDNPSVCKQLEIELLQFDVEVDYVPSARKAIEMFGKYQYRVAFLDVVLPDWDGYQICKHIKSKAPDTIVVMLSDKATASDKLRGALAGCDAYLTKPVNRQTFQATVKSHLTHTANTQALGA